MMDRVKYPLGRLKLDVGFKKEEAIKFGFEKKNRGEKKKELKK